MNEYFPHDYTAQHDEKIEKLVLVMGWEGYGLYWAIVEKVYMAGGSLIRDYDSISFAIRTDPVKVKKIVEDFDLFDKNSEKIISKSILKRLKNREAISKKRKMAAQIMHKKQRESNNANAQHMPSICTAIKEKKRKVNKIKEKEVSQKTIAPKPAPKPLKPQKETDHELQGTIDHICKTYETKRGYKYPFTGKHTKLLQGVAHIYSHATTKALWDVFLSMSDDFFVRTGYSIESFCTSLPKLLDGPWRSIRQKYETKDNGFSTPKSILGNILNGTDKN